MIDNIGDIGSVLFSVTGILVTVYIGFIGILAFFNPPRVKKSIKLLFILFLFPAIGIIAATTCNCISMVILTSGFSGWLLFSVILIMGIVALVTEWYLVKLIIEWANYRKWQESKEEES